MSSISAKPKPEDVTKKPKVTVATVKPNIHRIKADQENDEQLTPADDAVLKKRRLSPAMLKRSLTKVKEIDSEDDHPDASGADKDDPKREKVVSKKKGADEDEPTREKVASKKKEGADEHDPKREKVASKKKDANREDPEGENDHLEKLEDPNEEKSRKSKVKSKKTEDSDDEKSKGSKMQSKKTEDADGEIVSYEAHGEILHRGKKKSPPASVSDPQSEDHQNHRHRRGGWVIRKDDEFFHFIVACFAIGAVLICEHSYGDWTVSAGIGLLVFASLETIGIYFGFVTRIRAVLEGFLPLFQRSALPGFSNKK